MIIDTHAHYAPQAMLDALKKRAGDFPNVDLTHEGDNWRLAFAGRAPTRPMAPKLRDAEQRLKWMDAAGVDHQVCGGWLDAFGYELPVAEGAAWTRFLNDHLHEATARHGRLTPLASVPLQDGALAAEVLREVMDGGRFGGVMIGTQPKGDSGNLEDPSLDPFWQAASDLGATVYIHPMFGCGDPRLLDYDMINAVGRGLDTTTAVARMIFAGHFTRFPGMNVVLSHGGGALPYMLGRLRRNVAIHPGKYADVDTQVRGLYYDSVVFDPTTLRYLCDTVGADRVILGSDYPFPIGDHDPLGVVKRTRLTEIELQGILGKTAARLFRIEGGGCCG